MQVQMCSHGCLVIEAKGGDRTNNGVHVLECRNVTPPQVALLLNCEIPEFVDSRACTDMQSLLHCSSGRSAKRGVHAVEHH